ncbi:MAG TPA: thioesterase family protein [Geopsychrobacteraceae bacterium]|nr:thioesterase family protein [Geopsychrobacteraceae bacterium]
MDGFRFVMPYCVHVADVNYGGHVANSAVLNIFQDGRIKYLAEVGSYSELKIGEDCGIIMPEAHVYYRAEMFLHEQLLIGVRTTQVKRSSFTLEYRIERDGVLTVEGNSNLLAFRYATRKVVRLPETFREGLVDFEGL